MKQSLINIIQVFRELGTDFLILRHPEIMAPEAIPRPSAPEAVTPQRALLLEELQQEVLQCRQCSLHESKTNYVFGEGALDPDLMFVGEAPGKNEDLCGRPFVGEAGMLLEKLIEKIGYSRGQVFIANILKCRPPANRTPTADEARICIPFLVRQIAIIRPRVIVTLGNVALNYLLNENLQITKARGRLFSFRGLPVVPTYHPAFLVREKRKEQLRNLKWQMLSDVQLALAELKKSCG